MAVMAPKPRKPRTSDIYRWRTGKKWTQDEMAKELGISRTTLHRLEERKALPKRYQRAFDDLKAKNP